jgi:ABC-type transport system substrate-binding protein
MDPYTMNNTMTLGFKGNIYEGLVRHDKNEAIEPCLATEWKTVKPDVWRFNLRKNVTFHDGMPFTAEDVILSWKRAISQGSDMKSFVNGIKDRTPQPGQGNWNCGNYSNPKVDELLDLMTREIDPAKRQALIDEAMLIHKEDVGHIPLHQQALAWGANDKVEIHQSADNTFSLRWVVVK